MRCATRDRGPRKRTVRYVEEAGGTRLRVVQHSQDGSLRRCSRGGVRNAGWACYNFPHGDVAPMKKLALVLETIKFEHTIFALPFAFLGAFLAAR